MFDVGGGELILILLVILLLFGPKKIPEFAQQVGRGIRQFRKAQEDLTQQIRDISADVAVRDASTNISAKLPVVITPPDEIVSRSQVDDTEPDKTDLQGTNSLRIQQIEKPIHKALCRLSNAQNNFCSESRIVQN